MRHLALASQGTPGVVWGTGTTQVASGIEDVGPMYQQGRGTEGTGLRHQELLILRQPGPPRVAQVNPDLWWGLGVWVLLTCQVDTMRSVILRSGAYHQTLPNLRFLICKVVGCNPCCRVAVRDRETSQSC
jgi:hypothetical protein